MKNKYSKYLKGLFISSITTLIATDSNAESYNLSKIQEENFNINNPTGIKKELSPKLLLAFNSDNSYSSIGHRSHRSHSSHRSHYSSYNGGTTKTNPSQDLIQKAPKSSSTISTSNSISVKNLGDRIIKVGMRGADVTQLINILIKKGYLILQDGSKSVVGEYEYTSTISDAVKEFQKNNNQTSDGIVGVETVYLLKSESSK